MFRSAGPSDLKDKAAWAGSVLGRCAPLGRAPGPSLQVAGCWSADG